VCGRPAFAFAFALAVIATGALSCADEEPAAERVTYETVAARCASATASRTVPLKAMTLNLRHDADEWQRRMELVADEIVRLDPDIIGLQEVAVGARQLEVLGDLVVARGHARYETQQQAKRGLIDYPLDEAAAILSRWPIVERRHRDLVFDRVAVLARIAHPSGGTLDVLDTHLENRRDPGYDEVRVAQLSDAMQLASDGEACNPLLLTADLNSTDTAPAYAAAIADGFVDSYLAVNGAAATTARGNTAILQLREGAFLQRPSRRIDYVLARAAGQRTLTPTASDVCFGNHDAKGFHPSDHYGVITTFDVRF
jgi:beta-glucosidase